MLNTRVYASVRNKFVMWLLIVLVHPLPLPITLRSPRPARSDAALGSGLACSLDLPRVCNFAMAHTAHLEAAGCSAMKMLNAPFA